MTEPKGAIVTRLPDGSLRCDRWEPCIKVAGSFLDAMTRGDMLDGRVRVSGYVERTGERLTRIIWRSITFVCVNGDVTYDFIAEEYEAARDLWAGVLRSVVDQIMAQGA